MIEGTGIAEQNRPFQGTGIAEHSHPHLSFVYVS